MGTASEMHVTTAKQLQTLIKLTRITTIRATYATTAHLGTTRTETISTASLLLTPARIARGIYKASLTAPAAQLHALKIAMPAKHAASTFIQTPWVQAAVVRPVRTSSMLVSFPVPSPSLTQHAPLPLRRVSDATKRRWRLRQPQLHPRKTPKQMPKQDMPY